MSNENEQSSLPTVEAKQNSVTATATSPTRSASNNASPPAFHFGSDTPADSGIATSTSTTPSFSFVAAAERPSTTASGDDPTLQGTPKNISPTRTSKAQFSFSTKPFSSTNNNTTTETAAATLPYPSLTLAEASPPSTSTPDFSALSSSATHKTTTQNNQTANSPLFVLGSSAATSMSTEAIDTGGFLSSGLAQLKESSTTTRQAAASAAPASAAKSSSTTSKPASTTTSASSKKKQKREPSQSSSPAAETDNHEECTASPDEEEDDEHADMPPLLPPRNDHSDDNDDDDDHDDDDDDDYDDEYENFDDDDEIWSDDDDDDDDESYDPDPADYLDETEDEEDLDEDDCDCEDCRRNRGELGAENFASFMEFMMNHQSGPNHPFHRDSNACQCPNCEAERLARSIFEHGFGRHFEDDDDGDGDGDSSCDCPNCRAKRATSSDQQDDSEVDDEEEDDEDPNAPQCAICFSKKVTLVNLPCCGGATEESSSTRFCRKCVIKTLKRMNNQAEDTVPSFMRMFVQDDSEDGDSCMALGECPRCRNILVVNDVLDDESRIREANFTDRLRHIKKTRSRLQRVLFILAHSYSEFIPLELIKEACVSEDDDDRLELEVEETIRLLTKWRILEMKKKKETYRLIETPNADGYLSSLATQEALYQFMTHRSNRPTFYEDMDRPSTRITDSDKWIRKAWDHASNSLLSSACKAARQFKIFTAARLANQSMICLAKCYDLFQPMYQSPMLGVVCATCACLGLAGAVVGGSILGTGYLIVKAASWWSRSTKEDQYKSALYAGLHIAARLALGVSFISQGVAWGIVFGSRKFYEWNVGEKPTRKVQYGSLAAGVGFLLWRSDFLAAKGFWQAGWAAISSSEL